MFEVVWSLFEFCVCLEFVWSLFRDCLNNALSLFEVRLGFICSSFGFSWSLFIVCFKFRFEVCQEFVWSLNIQTNFKTSVFMRSKLKLVLLDDRGQNVPL